MQHKSNKGHVIIVLLTMLGVVCSNNIHQYVFTWNLEFEQGNTGQTVLSIDIPKHVTHFEANPPEAVASVEVVSCSGSDFCRLEVEGVSKLQLIVWASFSLDNTADDTWAIERHFSATSGTTAITSNFPSCLESTLYPNDTLASLLPGLPQGYKAIGYGESLMPVCKTSEGVVASFCVAPHEHDTKSLYIENSSQYMFGLTPGQCAHLPMSNTASIFSLASRNRFSFSPNTVQPSKSWLPQCTCAFNVMCRKAVTRGTMASHQRHTNIPHNSDIVFYEPYAANNTSHRIAPKEDIDVDIHGGSIVLATAYALTLGSAIFFIFACYAAVVQQSLILRDTYGARWLASYNF